MNKIKELKELCKKMAHDIRVSNRAYKELQRGNLTWEAWMKVPSASSRDFRHYHIAYCMLRGTPYERIEPKVNPGNEPDWKLIDKFREQFQGVPDEAAVRVGPA